MVIKITVQVVVVHSPLCDPLSKRKSDSALCVGQLETVSKKIAYVANCDTSSIITIINLIFFFIFLFVVCLFLLFYYYLLLINISTLIMNRSNNYIYVLLTHSIGVLRSEERKTSSTLLPTATRFL